MRLENPLCADIRARYPFAFACALARRRPDEGRRRRGERRRGGVLALALALAMERRRMRTARPKNVLVVCASGMGSAELLAMRCREEFGDQLGSIRTLDVSQVASTTSPISITSSPPCRCPARSRSPSARSDTSSIDATSRGSAPCSRVPRVPAEPPISSRRTCSSRICAPSPARTRFYSSRRCAPSASGSPRSSPITCCVASAAPRPPSATASPSRIPHVFAFERTFVCVGLADEPIPWGSRQVEVVLLISVAGPRTPEDLRDFYDSILCLASDRGALARLLDDRCFPTLLELLARASEGDRLGLDEKQGGERYDR